MSKSLLILVSVFAIVSLAQSVKPVQNKHVGSLHYYNKFEKKHGWAPNANIPLGKHFSNEKRIREHLYKLEAKVQHMKRGEGFKVRDIKRAILANENLLAKTEAIAKADNRLHNQKEQAIKEGINHNEKFKEKYQKRFLKNHNKLAHALPDQEPEFLALENFDQKRENALGNLEAQEQQRLNRQRKEDMEANIKSSGEVSHLKGEIGQEEASLKSLKDDFKYKIEDMEGQIAQLQEMVNAEANLDEKRVHNEHTEARLAKLNK